MKSFPLIHIQGNSINECSQNAFHALVIYTEGAEFLNDYLSFLRQFSVVVFLSASATDVEDLGTVKSLKETHRCALQKRKTGNNPPYNWVKQ